MCFRFPSALLAIAFCANAQTVLRVCADSENLPFSNRRDEGFENRIAERLAQDIGARVEFVWWDGHKGLVKNTLNEGRCDVLMGVPATLESVAATAPYYRSTYVFVTRKGAPPIISFDDPRLREMRIGVHMTAGDYAPPAAALGRRGLAANVRGYRLFGMPGQADAPARLIRAVATGDVDAAIVWGPLAGYFAKHEQTPLEITPVSPQSDAGVPFAYDISIGVRKENHSLRAALDSALHRNCAAVQAILREYGVPQWNGGGTCEPSRRSSAASSR